jgi:hypothetical protein
LFIEHVFVSFHHQLMRARDVVDVVRVVKLTANATAEEKTRSLSSLTRVVACEVWPRADGRTDGQTAAYHRVMLRMKWWNWMLSMVQVCSMIK